MSRRRVCKNTISAKSIYDDFTPPPRAPPPRPPAHAPPPHSPALSCARAPRHGPDGHAPWRPRGGAFLPPGLSRAVHATEGLRVCSLARRAARGPHVVYSVYRRSAGRAPSRRGGPAGISIIVHTENSEKTASTNVPQPHTAQGHNGLDNGASSSRAGERPPCAGRAWHPRGRRRSRRVASSLGALAVSDAPKREPEDTCAPRGGRAPDTPDSRLSAHGFNRDSDCGAA